MSLLMEIFVYYPVVARSHLSHSLVHPTCQLMTGAQLGRVPADAESEIRNAQCGDENDGEQQ